MPQDEGNLLRLSVRSGNCRIYVACARHKRHGVGGVDASPSGFFSCLGTPGSVSEDSGLKAMSKTTGRQYVDLGGECGHRDRRR